MKPNKPQQLNWQTWRVWYRTQADRGWLDVQAASPGGARERAFTLTDAESVYDVERIQR